MQQEGEEDLIKFAKDNSLKWIHWRHSLLFVTHICSKSHFYPDTHDPLHFVDGGIHRRLVQVPYKRKQ